MKDKKIIVTGCAGFIGMHLCIDLLLKGDTVLGIDNLNNYYDVNLKKNRLEKLLQYKNFIFSNIDISNKNDLELAFKSFSPDRCVNLAAQAGVRYSIENPNIYIKTNVVGFMNILECCRNFKTNGLIYASSSSVYGSNKKHPFSIEDRVDNPISIYAASKKSNELMANVYSHLYGLNTTGLRLFTVYGPWGRPDMAMYIFSKKIINNEPIPLFNHGKMERDFTYIDDVVSGIISSLNKNYKCEIFNLGNNRCEVLMDVVKLIEKSLGKKANLDLMNMQPGDVKKTFSDINYSKKKLGFSPKISIKKGIPEFIKWFKYYNQL